MPHTKEIIVTLTDICGDDYTLADHEDLVTYAFELKVIHSL